MPSERYLMTSMIGTLTWEDRKERSLALIEKLFIDFFGGIAPIKFRAFLNFYWVDMSPNCISKAEAMQTDVGCDGVMHELIVKHA